MTLMETFFIMMAVYHAADKKEQASTCMVLGVIAAAVQGMGL